MLRLELQATGSAAVAALLAAGLGLPFPLRAMAALAIAVWLTGFVNAFNFMDGVNGISGAHALIGGVAYACLGEWRQDTLMITGGLATAVGACAFLPWNARPGPGLSRRRGQLRARRGPRRACRLRHPRRSPGRGGGRPGRPVPGGYRAGRCSAGSGAASGGLRRTARTSTSAGATRACHTRRSPRRPRAPPSLLCLLGMASLLGEHAGPDRRRTWPGSACSWRTWARRRLLARRGQATRRRPRDAGPADSRGA